MSALNGRQQGVLRQNLGYSLQTSNCVTNHTTMKVRWYRHLLIAAACYFHDLIGIFSRPSAARGVYAAAQNRSYVRLTRMGGCGRTAFLWCEFSPPVQAGRRVC